MQGVDWGWRLLGGGDLMRACRVIDRSIAMCGAECVEMNSERQVEKGKGQEGLQCTGKVRLRLELS